MTHHRAQPGIRIAVGAITFIAAWGCASAPRRQSADPIAMRASTDSTVKLLACIQDASGQLGYMPLERANEAHFRRVDAEGYDGRWYKATTAHNTAGTILIAESWVDSMARPQLFVTAYQTENGRIAAVEPGLEKNRRLGARLQPSPVARGRALTPDVTADLDQIRSTCSTQSS
jgi:hypothetical protein